MVYLLLAVCASASIALLFKIAARVGASGNIITTVNYLTAALCSGAMVLFQGPDFFLPDLSAFLGSLGERPSRAAWPWPSGWDASPAACI